MCSTTGSIPATVTLPDFAFLGKAGSGKSTAADFLVEHFGYTKLSFAQPLKDVAASIWGTEARSDRDKLQKLGVAVREIDAGAWARLLVEARANRLARTRSWDIGVPRFVVDDLRFPNEHQLLAEAGFEFVRVFAPVSVRIDRLKAIGKFQSELQLEHISETALDDIHTPYALTNDETTADFREQLTKIINREAARS